MYEVVTIGGMRERLEQLDNGLATACKCTQSMGGFFDGLRELIARGRSAIPSTPDPLPAADALFGPRGWGKVAVGGLIAVGAVGLTYVGVRAYQKTKRKRGK